MGSITHATVATGVNDAAKQVSKDAWNAGHTITLDKTDVALGNVDNTSDAGKPVSTATQTALNGKQDLDADLTALAALSTTGMMARTAANTYTMRALTGTANRITITNGDGVAGAPTFDIGANVATLAGAEAFTNKTYNGNTFTAGTGTLTIAAGKTATVNNTLTLAGTDATTMTFPPASASVGYINIPQNSKSAAYTTVLADAGKHVYHPSADTTARTWTIDSNANVAYPIGTAITFVNDTSGGVITIAITSDTLVLAGPGTTGSRTLAANGVATAIKMTTTRWIISGTGLT